MPTVRVNVESFKDVLARSAELFAPLSRALEIEQQDRRPFLWVPVLFACGLGLYFALLKEPDTWLMLLTAFAFLLGAYLFRQIYAASLFCMCSALIFAGVGYGALRAQTKATVFVPHIVYGPLQGWITKIDERENDFRLLLKVHVFEHEKFETPPSWIRVNVKDLGEAQAGDLVELKAHLFPPPNPSRPNGYNFARDAYFAELGAVGYSREEPQRVDNTPAAPWYVIYAAELEKIRQKLHLHIVASAGDTPEGQVAAALITGKRAGLSDEINTTLQASGLYHILSISGLHLMLFGGALFWLIRQVLVMAPRIGQTMNVKAWAAFITALGVSAYSVLSGFEVATERALIMMLVSLGAVIINRRALSLRNVAISALIVLLHRPESIVSISAQLSFASVTLLIVGYEQGWILGKKRTYTGIFLIDRFLLMLRVAVVSGLLASFATTPLIASQFQRVNPWGLLGNVITEPITAFLIMPSGLLGLVTMPFGLDGIFWQAMAYGCSLLLQLAAWVGDFSYAITRHKALSPALPAVFGLFFCWLFLWRSRIRFLALLLAPWIVYMLFVPTTAPLAYLDTQGKAMAVRTQDKSLALLNAGSAKFAARSWLDADGDARDVKDEGLTQNIECDKSQCSAPLAGGGTLVLIKQARAFKQACLEATLIVAPFWEVWAPCSALVFDKRHIPYGTSAAIYKRENGAFELVPARQFIEQRPWQHTLKPVVLTGRPSTKNKENKEE